MLGNGSIFGIILIVLRTKSRRLGGRNIWRSKEGTRPKTSSSTSMDSSISSSKDNKTYGSLNSTSIVSSVAPIQKIIQYDNKIYEQVIYRCQENEDDEVLLQEQELNQPSIMEAIKRERSLTKKLLGTAGCWFLFDVLFYGNTLFQPLVLHSVFGSQESLLNTARDSTIMALLALPGYFISIACVGRQSPRFIQMQGFVCMSALYFAVGNNFELLSKNRTMLIILYGLTFFFSDYGPNTTVSTSYGL